MKRTFPLILLIAFLLTAGSFACSDFRVTATDGSVVVGRSMEFPIDLQSDIRIVPRGATDSSAADGAYGFNWTSKYAFLGINGFKVPDGFIDGFNEQGLSLEGLMFVGAQYQTPVPGKSITFDKFSSWLLGNFSTVDEVKSALATVNVIDTDIKELKGMGLHIAIHDARGKSLVIEFIDGRMNVYDNPLGVMTNRPEFPWHMNNLRNYVNLDSHDRSPRMINGVTVEPMGVGSGMLGLPGDWTPPSRFVRLALCVDAALKPANANEAVILAQHLLNVVDIPMGVIKEESGSGEIYGNAQWVIIKDLTNKVLYFKTYDDTAWKSVDLKKFDLKPGAPGRTISINEKAPAAIDVSGKLK